MRDDLISRKETERILRAYADDVGCNRGEYVLANGILKAVSRVIDPEIVPTAYDVGKVVKKLNQKAEDAMKYWKEFDDEDAFGEMNAYGNAIEIVKSGGGADE